MCNMDPLRASLPEEKSYRELKRSKISRSFKYARWFKVQRVVLTFPEEFLLICRSGSEQDPTLCNYPETITQRHVHRQPVIICPLSLWTGPRSWENLISSTIAAFFFPNSAL